MGENFKNNRMKSKELGNRIIGKIFSIMCVSLSITQLSVRPPFPVCSVKCVISYTLVRMSTLIVHYLNYSNPLVCQCVSPFYMAFWPSANSLSQETRENKSSNPSTSQRCEGTIQVGGTVLLEMIESYHFL